MGKGAQFEDRASRGGAVASTSQPGMSPPSALADPAFEGKDPAGSRALGVGAYDVTLTNGRTGGGVDARDRAALAEARLLETQQVLVQERLQREVAESILAETAKALSAVRRAAADGGAGAFAKDGVSLKGGGDEVNAMLNERFSLLTKEYDALRLESASKEVALAKANDEVRRLDDDASRAAGGARVTIPISVKEMTSADQDELVLNSRTLLDRAKDLERYVGELVAVDEQRVRTLAEVMSTMESRQGELKQKLRDHGLLDDDEYDDARVWELSQGRFLSAEGKAALAHMHDVEVTYDGPATSPLGKNFYVTRTAGAWDRWFGTHC
jgi:hypothetical protein